MKTMIVSTLIALSSQSALAASMNCAANVESKPGSMVYDKMIHSEKLEVANKSYVRFLLADGTVLKAEDITPEKMEKIDSTTRAFSITFLNEKPNLFIGRANKQGQEIKFTNMAASGTFDGKTAYLIANDLNIGCVVTAPTQK